MSQIIPLYRGRGDKSIVVALATVSDFWYPKLCNYRWGLTNNGYAYRMSDTNNKKETILLHREIMNPPKDMEVDHINFNPLDNNDENLRICTPSENTCHRRMQSNNTSGFKGVSFGQAPKLWTAKVTFNGKNTFIGRYETAIEAALAYDYVARRIHLEYVIINFPNQPEVPNSFLDELAKGKRFDRDRKSYNTNKSGYRGVCWDKGHKKWGAAFQHKGKRTHAGFFDDIEAAARARDKIAYSVLGEFAELNFPINK